MRRTHRLGHIMISLIMVRLQLPCSLNLELVETLKYNIEIATSTSIQTQTGPLTHMTIQIELGFVIVRLRLVLAVRVVIIL